MVKRGGSVNPAKFPDETFDLFSIPAFDRGEVDVLAGQEIGSSKAIIAPDDVLISKIIPHIRRCQVVPKTSLNRQIGSGEWIIFRSPNHHPNFLRHFLISDHFHRQFMSTVAGMGGSLVRARPAAVAEIKIPLPPLEEQKRIAGILDRAEGLRRKRAHAITLTNTLLRSIFLDMFGDPVTNPMGWPRKAFSELAKIDTKMVDPKTSKYIDLLHIGPDVIERETGKFLPAKTAREEGVKSGKYLFDESHILYTKIRPYLQKVVMPDFKGICSADVYPILPIRGAATKEFLWAVLISPAYVAYFNGLSDRANIPKINMKEMNAYQCMAPPIEQQERFSYVLKEIVSTLENLENGMKASSNLAASLTQRAFNGELPGGYAHE